MPHTLTDIFTYTADVPSLSVEQETALIREAQQGDDVACYELLLTYGPALRQAVGRFTRQYDASERAEKVADAQGVALLAFMEVLREHDTEKSPRLAGPIAQRLRRALADHVTQDAAMTIPERTLSRFYGILRKADGDVTEARALAPEMGMTVDVFEAVYDTVRNTLYISGLVDSEEEAGHGDHILMTPLTSEVYRPYDEVEDALMVSVAFSAVDDDEARVIECAYGFTTYNPMSDAEVADYIGTSRPTAQRRRVSGLTKMRKALGVSEETR